MVLIDSANEVVALEQGLEVGTGIGGEVHGSAVEAIELGADGLVEEQENEDRGFGGRGFDGGLGGGRGIEGGHDASHYGHASSVPVLKKSP